MSPANHAAHAYRNAEVTTLTQRDLIVKLYQGAERFLIQAKAGMANDKEDLVLIGCQKAKRIFVELTATLNFEQGGDIAEQLRNLYVFLIGEIGRASQERDPGAIEGILPIIATLREAWQNVPDEHANTSSMPQPGQSHTLNIRT